ncbi:acyltransferase family protein [Pontibacter rugosus]|uniref:Acyltransferase n=1 Tax=Pontibacter rugosus TaxID=1745966 RepID=A0ABW3SMS8_9BACT
MKQHFQQIDVVKGVAILMVLLLHSLTRQDLLKSYAVYHIWQAVPLFMVIMGLNLGLSVQRKDQNLQDLYSRSYFSKKAIRIIAPFLIVFAVSIPVGLVWQWLQGEKVLHFDFYNLIGVLPVTGKGNYFITLLLQSILLLPIIGYAFSRKPVITSILLILLEVAFQLWSSNLTFFDTNDYLYSAAFVRYFSAIVYGLWLAKYVLKYKQTKLGLVLSISACVAGVIFWLVLYTGFKPSFIRPEWSVQQLFTFGYAAFWLWVAIRLLPSSSTALPLQFLATLGKASYHIFLIQVLFFGLADEASPLWLNLSVCLLFGFIFFKYEDKIIKLLSLKSESRR